jgi:hypothetical protein
MKVIFAQGNPEPDYANTRHNIGFTILNAISDYEEFKWSTSSKFSAQIIETKISGEKVLFVKPTTFYNETGASIKKIIDFYKLDPKKDLLIIHDDLSLPFKSRILDANTEIDFDKQQIIFQENNICQMYHLWILQKQIKPSVITRSKNEKKQNMIQKAFIKF